MLRAGVSRALFMRDTTEKGDQSCKNSKKKTVPLSLFFGDSLLAAIHKEGSNEMIRPFVVTLRFPREAERRMYFSFS